MAAFTPGNIVVYRVGDGSAALGSSAAAVFLDEYTTAGVKVNTYALPTNDVGSNQTLTAAGSATSEGELTRSADGQFLVLTGYDAGVGTANLAATTSASVNRVVGLVDSAGAINTTTVFTTAFSGNNIRGAASVDGTAVWASGTASMPANGGVWYEVTGTSSATQILATPSNDRAVEIYGGQLYVSSGSSPYVGIDVVGTGLPTTSGQTATLLTGTSSTSPYQFYFADLSSAVAGVDTLYVADNTGTNGLEKFSLVGSAWVLNNKITTPAGMLGLTASTSGNTVSLFITTSTGIYSLTDTAGYNANDNGTATQIVTAATNTAFRGVAFAPQAIAAPSETISFLNATTVTQNEGNSGSTPFTYTLTRTGSTTNQATVAYAVTGGATNPADATDFTGGTLPTGTATFAAGSATATITINVAGDTTVEPNESFTLTLSSPSSGYVVSSTANTASGTITNDDVALPTLSIANASVVEGNSGTTALTFTVTSSAAAPAGGISFTAASADGTATVADPDYTAISSTFTIPAGATSTTVTILVNGDTKAESNETLTVTLSAPSGATIAAGGGTAMGTIIDDDSTTIIPTGSFATTFAAANPGNYQLIAGGTRTQTAGTALSVTATGGAANVDIEGTLNDTGATQVAINYGTGTSGLITVGAAGTAQSINGNTVTVASVNGTVNLTNLGQILATTAAFTPAVGGTNPGTDFAVTYNTAKGASGADATDFTSGGTITNGSATNAAALIRSDNGDAIRLGSHETLVNWGTINADGPVNDSSANNSFNAAGGNTSTATTYDIARGVRLNQSGETAVAIQNHGTIVGSQHGVDMGVTNITNVVVTNFAGATILGHNGSGVGGDTTVATASNVQVINSGIIRGEYAPQYDRAGYTTVDGDGDGVDIDGGATIINNAGGIIQGGGTATNPAARGAGGFDSGGRANASEGLSLGGGIVNNYGLISGADAGIVVNNDANTDGSRTGTAATTITNYATGTIIGQASYAIRLENKSTATPAINDDTILNYGAITGNAAIPTGTVLLQNGNADASTVGTLDGTTYAAADAGSARFIRGDGAAIQTGEGNDSVADYGTITGNVSGRAINLEGGNDTLTLYTGSTVTGRIDGGAGSDTIVLKLDDRAASGAMMTTGNNSGATTGTLANVINVEALSVASGTWTIADAQGYSAGSTIATGAKLILGTGSSLTGAIVDNGRLTTSTGAITLAGAISGSGVVEQAGSGTLTLAVGNSYGGGTVLTAGTLDLAALGAAGTGGITFGSGAQTLRIEAAALNAGAFANAITGFAAGDTLDVRGIGTATASYNGTTGILTLAGTSNATLNIGTGYNGFNFNAASDGAGGTAVTISQPSLTISDPTVIEGNVGGTSLLHYVVTASAAAPASGISFTIVTADGTATAGSDYVARTATGTIAAGQTSYAFDVQVNGDTTPEPAETVLVNLSNPANATIARGQGTGTIDNDDGAPTGLQPYFSANFTGFTAAGFSPTPGTGQLDSNVWRVVGLSDNANPAFGFTGPSGGDFGRGIIAGSADPVSAGVYSPSANAALILQPTGAEIENGGFIEAQLVNHTGFTATSIALDFDWAYRNSGARADALQLSYSTDGVTYIVLPAGAFTTPATADTAVAATFTNQHETVTIDNVLVGDGSPLYLRWTHTGSTGGGNRDEVGIDNVVVRANVSDVATLSASDISVTEGTGGTSFATFTVTRSSGTGAASVAYATADGTALAGSDYTATSGTLTFAEGERSKTVTVAITPDSANEANETFFLNFTNATGVTVTDPQAQATIVNDDTGPVAIYNIQGAGHVSPFNGQVVTTTGIVTAISANSFWIQDPFGDGVFATSDGLQVFTKTAPAGVAVGDAVTVMGSVTEFVPTTGALSVTEIGNSTTPATFTVSTHNNPLPAPVVIGIDGILPPTNVVNDNHLTVFDPTHNGTDFYEALEGMLVTVESPIVTGNTMNRGTFVVASQGQGSTDLDARGGTVLTANDAAPERIQIFADSTLLPGYTPNHTIGDVLGNVTGILSYYSYPELLPTQPVTVVKDTDVTREQTTLTPDADHIQIASFNMENADPTDPQAKFDAIGVEVVTALHSPDIIGAQEIQDADGAGAGTDYSGTATAQKVIDAIKAAGGPTYTYVEVAPTANNTTGGEPNGNIRPGFFYNAARVTLVDGSVTQIQDPAYNNTRKPLVAQFVFNGTTLTVIDQHSTSRGGSDLAFGANQPPAQAGDAARTAQAMAIKAYINNLQTADPNVHVVTLGDWNGYYYEPALSSLTADGKLTNLYSLLPVEERYSYVFDGASQAFDNIIVTNNLLPNAQFDVVHYNAEQPVQNITDHDQVVTSLSIPRPNTAPTGLSIDTSSIAENQPAGSLVGTVTGTDNEGGTLTYSLTDNAGGRFAIDAAMGRLTTNQPFDYEATTSATVTVRVTDSGGLTYDKPITIAVTDVNEAPTALALTGGSVAENAPAGTIVGTLAGTDPDAGGTLTYSLVDNGGGRFTVDAATGRITTTQPLDYETLQSVTVTARVTDQGGLTYDKAFTVAVANVNEAPTALALSGGSVAENSPAGTMVGTLAGSDPDAGATLRYSLVDNGGGRFAVDATTGQVTTTQPLDYEALRSVAITARVTDQGGLTLDKAFTVAVTNVNEAPTAPVLSNASVAENAPAGTLVGTAVATDPDAGDTLRYSLVSNPGALFAIDAATGRLTTTAPLDYEAAASRPVTIRATDAGGLFADRAVTIAVNDVNEAPTKVTISSASVTENAPGGTVIGTLSGNDLDANETVTFALVTDDPRFHIEANRLVVSNGAVIDYESQQSIALAVTATDHAGLSVTNTLTLAVQDVAETVPGPSGGYFNGGSGNDMIVGSAGNDVITGGPGADVLTLGAGADTVRGILADMFGDTITDFTTQDRIQVLNSDLHRSDFTVTGTGANTAIKFAGGSVTLSAGVAGGDLMVAHSGSDSIITLDPYLAPVNEGQRVSASAINGIVNQPYLTGDTSTSFTVKIEAISGAYYSNSLGVYEIDSTTGAISDVRIIAANVKTGGTLTVGGVDVGHQLGFFIVQNGANTLSSAVLNSTTLSVVNQDGHLALADHGSIVVGATTFFSHAASANVDGMAHVLSGVAPDGSGDLRIGFEDALRSGSSSDDDFQDVVLTVDATPVSHVAAVMHIPETVVPVLHG